jgi:hypothetical protein
VWLDGRRVRWDEDETNRGLEVTVETRPGERRLLVRSK